MKKDRAYAKKTADLITEKMRQNKHDYFTNDDILRKFLQIAQSSCPHNPEDIEIADFSKWCKNCGYIYYC